MISIRRVKEGEFAKVASDHSQFHAARLHRFFYGGFLSV